MHGPSNSKGQSCSPVLHVAELCREASTPLDLHHSTSIVQAVKVCNIVGDEHQFGPMGDQTSCVPCIGYNVKNRAWDITNRSGAKGKKATGYLTEQEAVFSPGYIDLAGPNRFNVHPYGYPEGEVCFPGPVLICIACYRCMLL